MYDYWDSPPRDSTMVGQQNVVADSGKPLQTPAIMIKPDADVLLAIHHLWSRWNAVARSIALTSMATRIHNDKGLLWFLMRLWVSHP
jgi:hypothetical protein